MTMNRTGGERTARWLAAAALVLLSFGAAGCDKFKSKQLIREGNAYFKEQLYEDALKKYEQAQALDPDEVRLDKFVAMGNMALYNPGSTHPKDIAALTKAIEHFKKYLAARPDDEKAAKFLVTTYMNAQKYDDAIEYFKDFIGKHPKDSQAVQTVAMLYAKKGDLRELDRVAEASAPSSSRTTPTSSTRWASRRGTSPTTRRTPTSPPSTDSRRRSGRRSSTSGWPSSTRRSS